LIILSAKENFIEAINYGTPDYVPLSNEPIRRGVSFNDLFKMENWTDRFGVGWEMGLPGTVPFPKKNPLADIENNLDGYVFPNPDDLVMDIESVDRLKNPERENYIITGNLTYFCYERVWSLMGMENFLTALIEFPDEVRFVIHETAKFARGVFDRYLELGADAVSFSEDLGTQNALMMSPAHFREFFLNEYVYAFENVLKEKKMVFFHSCGCVTEIAKDLAEINITVLNPVQARANDLRKLKKDVFGKTALEGGVDTHLLLTGTPAEVKKETLRVMEILKPGGGYVCGPDQGFPNMPEENMNMLWKTASEAGRY